MTREPGDARYAISVDDRGAVWVQNAGQRTSASDQATSRRSGGAPFVVVMQTADVWDLDDRVVGWRLNGPRDGSIFVQREVSPPLVIVGEVTLRAGRHDW